MERKVEEVSVRGAVGFAPILQGLSPEAQGF